MLNQKLINNSRKHLFFIDSDSIFLELVKDYLDNLGYYVTTFTQEREAFSKLVSQLPDMIICDLIMLKMNGYVFISKLRQDSRTSWIPVLFLSASCQNQERIEGLRAGADVYMTKPFEPEELVAQIEASLKQVSRLVNFSMERLKENLKIQISQGENLSPSETKIVKLVAQGLTNQEIAKDLNIAPRTVSRHVQNVLDKTHLCNRTKLARWAIAEGYAYEDLA